MKRVLAILAIWSLIVPLRFLFAPTPVGKTQENCVPFTETQNKLCPPFLDYWNKHGGLAQQGFPISNKFPERVTYTDKNGHQKTDTFTVQYFERSIFEYHP